MQHLVFVFAVMIVVAHLCGAIAARFRQAPVLGELIGGIVIGTSGLGIVRAGEPAIEFLSQLGVILLLFVIGLETRLPKLLKAGGLSLAVAVTGVAVPLILGFAVSRLLGLSEMVSIYIGATLTATSVGITARVFSDLDRVHDPEAAVILGAAVADDVIGLVILAMVASPERLSSIASVVRTPAIAAGFLVVAVMLGTFIAPFFLRRMRARTLPILAVAFALTMAVAADRFGSAMIVGAFAAGLILGTAGEAPVIAKELRVTGDLLIPLFFVAAGAAVDLRSLDARHVAIGLLITAVAIAGKIVSGFVVWQNGLRKLVIGIGMIPRGEVGLIFAQMGLAAGVLSGGLYTALTLMIILTALVTPPALRILLSFPTSQSEVMSLPAQ